MDIDDIKKDFKQANDEQKINYAQGEADNSSKIQIKDSKPLDIFNKEQPQNTQPKEAIPTKRKRGRPKGSTNIDRNAVRSKKLTISLSEDEILQLKKKAEKQTRSVSSLIRLALIEQKLIKKAKSKY